MYAYSNRTEGEKIGMRRICLLLTVLCFALGHPTTAGAITLRTTSIFGGQDAAADIYAALLKSWQDETGHTVLDTSAPSDEKWKTGVLNDFAAGNEADILFFFAKTADSAPILRKVVPIHEINQAYPQAALMENQVVAEADGVVYAIPIRTFWEGLFCNVDLFEEQDLPLPTTWEQLEIAIEGFNKAGIVPISISLSDVPNYIAEFCILSAGSPQAHLERPMKGEAVPESWVEGMRLIRRLYELNAFPSDTNATTNDIIGQQFREKKAAMQLDGSWFANSLSPEAMETTIVLPFPSYAQDSDPTAFIGGVSMGFYLTRAAWENQEKRDAAVDLLAFLTTGENAALLGGFTFTGKLLESSYELYENANYMNPPFQDVMAPSVRGEWFASIPSIASGQVDPEQMWKELMEMDPFGSAVQE